MKKTRYLCFALAFFLLTALAAPAFAADTELRVTRPGEFPAIGGSFTVSVALSGNPGFSAIQMKLRYDDAVVRCDGVEGGALLENMLSSDNPCGTRGGVGALIAAASLDPVKKDGEVAAFRFTVIGAGDPGLLLTDITLVDENTQELAHRVTTVTLGSSGTVTEAPQETAQPKTFSDVPAKHWAAEHIARASALGLVEGNQDGTFQPEAPVTRAQFVTMLWRMAGKPQPGKAAEFSDVPAGAYYADAVAWASARGYVNGADAGQFRPDGNITREQVTAILHRYAGSPTGTEGLLRGVYDSQFSDSASVSSYARVAVYWAIYNGIVTGTDQTTLAPRQTANRAQIAVIFLRYIDKIK